jgi:type IV pilus assembly protein PilC
LAFTQKLALFMQSGLDVSKALWVLCQQQRDSLLKDVIFDLRTVVGEGWPFYEALKKHPFVFDHFYVYTVECGERGGFLPSAVQALADGLERNAKIRRECGVNLVYPAILFALGGLVLSSTLLFVVPQFERYLLQQLPLERIPVSTRLIFWIGRWFRHYGWLFGVSIAGVAWIRHRRHIHRRLGGPFRKIMESLRLGQMMGNISTMLANGVPILDALSLGGRLSPEYEREIRGIVDALGRGYSLSSAFGASSVFPDFVTEMIQAADENGRVADVFGRLSAYYLGEYKHRVSLFMKWIEPALIVLLAGLIGGFIVAILAPIVRLLKVL